MNVEDTAYTPGISECQIYGYFPKNDYFGERIEV